MLFGKVSQEKGGEDRDSTTIGVGRWKGRWGDEVWFGLGLGFF